MQFNKSTTSPKVRESLVRTAWLLSAAIPPGQLLSEGNGFSIRNNLLGSPDKTAGYHPPAETIFELLATATGA
jgi:hypothetical protein